MKVFVTGADRGLGYELVKQFLKNGDTVFAGQYLKEWGWLQELKQKHKTRLHLVDLDVGDDESVKAAAQYVSSENGSLDILVNNAGILGGPSFEATIFEQLDFNAMIGVFNVNALGALRITHALIGLLMKGETKLVVNISSEAGSIARCTRKGWFGYCMSKAALNMQSVILQNSIKDSGGQVIDIHPGWMKTYMSGEFNDEAELHPEVPARNIMKIIQNREKYKGDQPAFIDHLGNRWPW